MTKKKPGIKPLVRLFWVAWRKYRVSGIVVLRNPDIMIP
jgi:hypothetical protein